MQAAKAWDDRARDAWISGLPRLGDAGHRFRTEDADPEWVARFAPRQADTDQGLPYSLDLIADAGFRGAAAVAKARLRDGLLAFGGWGVCQPALDDDLDRIIARGVLLAGNGAKRVRGEPSRCHSNSVSYCRGRLDRAAVMTGYALSADGMWRPHSWVVEMRSRGGPAFVETTAPRVAYFGFVRSVEETAELDDGLDYPSLHDQLADMRSRLAAIETPSLRL